MPARKEFVYCQQCCDYRSEDEVCPKWVRGKKLFVCRACLYPPLVDELAELKKQHLNDCHTNCPLGYINEQTE